MCAPTPSRSPTTSCLSNLSVITAQALMSTLLSAEAVGVARWATDTAAEYAKIREQFGRPIGQFQAIKHKCAEMIADTERATAAVWDAARAIDEAQNEGHGFRRRVRRRGSGHAGTGGRPALHAGLHPGARRHRLHLGARHQRVLPPRADPGRLLRPRARSTRSKWCDTATTTGMRPVDIDLDPDTEKLRAEIRAEVAALKEMDREQRKVAIAEGGWVLPYLPKPWGRASSPVEQIIIAQEFSHRAGQTAAGRHRRVDHSVDRRVRHRRAEAAVPAADLPRRDDLVPAVLRAGRRIGPGRADHQGDPGRRRLAHHRPEDLDHRRAVLAVGRAAGAERTRARQNTMASPTSCWT